jgi:uncharacterized protein with HEPN domain
MDLLHYIDRIEQFTAQGRAAFMSDDKTYYAVIRCYEVIGEIAKRLPEPLLQQQSQIPWKKIKGFRDFLAHHYEEVALDMVWESVEQASDLRAAAQFLLATLPPQSDTQ